ncbi:LOW QUALITY PROTEIN: EF-hand calcium-binding domain-containing protein 4B-like [Leucoraja erinacea]|uniref:LOW QUALITY PROTEIN: EF-hand calcium-binding domain-containing protein 4B-like n=1 Tax=Leucoraja erinaceus TaxID=7782 RepID=UPI0024545137|nr:LOW QUALITY PROTEIN: EF-hand calcium-binding domain-containing protein 4B-like [Leucoraja erinacea]
MAERDNPNPKSQKLFRESRRTARRRRNLPESQEPKVEEDKGEKQNFGEKFVMEKVHEFFQECGVGERGFITREDMQKLQQKFPFSSEELEMVFDKLDVDTKGILTPEQLTEGLSHFLSDQGEDKDVSCLKLATEPQYCDSHSHSLQDQVDVEDEEKHQFATLMGKLGATVIFEDKSEIWKLWIQLRRNEPNLLGHLEDFLSKVTGQIQDTLHEKEDLERTLKKKMVEHNADTQRLYEEMELQINNEKERIEDEIVVRFQAQSHDLQKELDSKQEEVQNLVQVQAQLQAELMLLGCKQDEANTENQELKMSNQELKMSNQEMALQVEGIQQELQEARDRLVILKEETTHREEREGEWRQSLGLEGPRSGEAVQQLQAELVSMRSKHDEISTENQELKCLNQKLATGMEGIQAELQEARDRLEGKDGECNRTPDNARPCSEEADQQLQAELESLRSKQDETSTENQELHLTNQELEARLEGIKQELQEARDRLVILQEEAAHREEREGELDPSPGPCSKEAFQQLQAELVTLRSKQDETGTENQELHLTNRELEVRLEGIQQELQEARDRLVSLQEEAAHREERGGELDPCPGSAGPCTEEAFQELQTELVSLRSKQDETGTENQELHLTNQELEARMEGIQQELQEARDRLVSLQEEAAHREERGGEFDPSSGSVGPGSEETIQKLHAELVSLRSKEDETSTENQELHLTNHELEVRLEGIRQELQEARDRLVILQEEAAHREKGEGELDRTPGTEGQCSEEAIQQLQAELESLRSKQDKISTENQELHLTNQELEARLEGIRQELQEARDRLVGLKEEAAHRDEGEGLQRTRSIRRRVARDTSGKPDTPGEDPHLRVEGQEATLRVDGDGDHEETAAASAGDGTTETTKELQAELVSLLSKLDETSTENQELHLTNQELKTQLEQIQQELQEARDRPMILQEEATHREEGEGGEDQLSGSGRADSDEVVLQLQAELESLRSKQDETSTENQALTLINQELEARLVGIDKELQEARNQLVILQEEVTHREAGEGLQRTHSIRRRVTHDPHLQVKGMEVTLGIGDDEETAAASAGDGAEERTKKMAGSKDPDQVYNIMFVGNSNCGKTSFIQHFCDGNIQPETASTVGIDYRVKTLMVGDRHVALQLWDTAGQERYHCVTKQYFRKADAVIVMYDIASSTSFSKVHYWLACIKETTSDDVCILLLGNKMDDTAHRQVSKAEAEQLAQNYNILFYECSAHTGQNIIDCIVHLSKSLKQQEERIQGKTVELVKKPAEKRCC